MPNKKLEINECNEKCKGCYYFQEGSLFCNYPFKERKIGFNFGMDIGTHECTAYGNKFYKPKTTFMNEQDTQLLLIDLCARLQYGVKVCCINLSDEMPKIWDLIGMPAPHLADILVEGSHRFAAVNIEENIRPYLRPINTITKSEIADAIKYICDTDNVVWDNGTHGVGFYFYKSDGIKRPFDDFKFRLGCYGAKNIDWFNKFHFDYRGLIEKGLALEAPEGMYES